MSNINRDSCKNWTKSSSIYCSSDNLVLIEKLDSLSEKREKYRIEYFLKYCQICGIICKEKKTEFQNGSQYSQFYRIPEKYIQDCHCIGFLKPVEVVLDQKTSEGDEMYFAWERITKMQCEKCGDFYLENIYQNNFDGVYYQTYSQEKEDR